MIFKDGLIGNDPDIFYNSNGHRCKELLNLNYRNYILFAGDNISLGLDKPIENTYPYIVSKHFNIDFYNISIFNGGLDCTKLNLFYWLFTKPKPKMIVIGFEFLNAIVKTDIGTEKKISSVDYDSDVIKDLLYSGNYCGYFSGRNILFSSLFKNVCDIPTYQIHLDDREKLLDSYAIDIYCGNDIHDHANISNNIISKLSHKLSQIKP